MLIRDEQWEHFFKLVEAGASISDATAHAGMCRESVYKRRDRDEEFALKLETAIVAPKLKAIATVHKAMDTHWAAAAWWLERKYPTEFALKNREDDEGKNEATGRMAERAAEVLKKIQGRIPIVPSSNGNGLHS